MIEIQNCTATRAGRKLFQNLSFSIKEGEHWLIHGKNGSGKTALLELIAGHLNIVSGRISYSFITSTDWDVRHHQLRSAVRYIPAHSMHHLLTGEHELFYQQRYYSMGDERFPRVRDLFISEPEAKVLSTFPESLRISNLLDIELIRLSNGQLKKVLILQHLLKQTPRFLLLDYPFEGLDRQAREELIIFLDSIVVAFGTQLIIADHHHHSPRAINRKLVLNDLSITDIVKFNELDRPLHPVITRSRDVSTNNERDFVVEIRNLNIRYGSSTIINDLNWNIRKGERWVLTGRNGSGKTTLFSLIFADHPMAYAQQIFLFGKRRGSGESIWDIKNRIAYLGPEQLHFLDAPSYSATAKQFLSPKGINNKKLNELIALFSAQHLMEVPLRFLSSGQLQLVLFMQCLMKKKELLLLDEPFQFLDTENKHKAADYLNSTLDRDTTLVMITHYEDDLPTWALRKSV